MLLCNNPYTTIYLIVILHLYIVITCSCYIYLTCTIYILMLSSLVSVCQGFCQVIATITALQIVDLYKEWTYFS